MILLSLMFLLLAVAVNPAQSQEIQPMDNSVIMTCPGAEDKVVTWFKNKQKIEVKKGTYEVKADQGIVEGFYTCQYTHTESNKVNHEFYLSVKVCENCYELSGLMAWGVIIGDVLITGGVILIVYFFATKNSGGTQQRASNSRSLNPPQPPNPDYAPLDPKTRNNAVYAGIK